jgi:2-desacetyl-2-hydroxyethyl bacteriochlorophyllide A dehydrogenase
MHRAIRLDAPGRLTGIDAHTPAAPAAGVALVRVRRVGLCGTDFHAFGGDQPFFSYPRILGHELAVEVVELNGPADAVLSVGDLCAVEPYVNCGACIACRRGRPNCCVSLRVLGVHADGGLQEVIEVPVTKLHPSRTLPVDVLAVVEPLAIGAHAVRRASVDPGERILVVGAGPIGFAVMTSALAVGARVAASDVSDARLQFCRERLPIEETFLVQPDRRDDRNSDADPPTVVFDATGSAASMTASFDLVPNGGRLVFVGLVEDRISFSDPDFHRRELTLLGSRNATREDFAAVIERLESGHLDAHTLLTHRVPFDSLVERFPALMQPESRVFKAVVEIC